MMKGRGVLTFALMLLTCALVAFQGMAQEVNMSSAPLADVTLSVGVASGAPGSTNKLVAVSLTNSKAVYGVQFTLTYDAGALSVADVDSTERTKLMSFFAWNEPAPGTLEVVVLDINRSIAIGSGAIINIYFDVAADARCGNHPLTVTELMALDGSGNPLSVAKANGLFTISVTGVEISPSATSHNFGVVNIGSSAQWYLKIYNDGSAALNVTNIVSSSARYTVNRTNFTVSPCDSQQVTVAFTPNAGGVVTGTLTISNNDPNEGTLIINLSGEGCTQADIHVNPASVNFDTVDVGDYLDETVVVSNLGCQNLNVTSTTLTGTNANQFSIQSGGGTFALSPGQTRNIVVRFAPTSAGLKAESRDIIEMVKTATLRLANNDPDENPKDVPLSGTGCADQDINVSPATIGFGTVNQGATKDSTIVVSNTGCQTLNVASTIFTGTNADQFSIVSGGGSFSVPQGGTRNMVIRFAPTSGGAKTAQLQIASDDPDEASVVVTLSGTGCTPPDVEASPTTLNFASVNQGSTKDLTAVVTNTGCQTLSVTATGISGTDADQFSIFSGGGSFTVAQGGTRNIVVRFAPTSGGGKSAQLAISSNDPDENPYTITLNGSGCTPPDLSVSPNTWDYGTVNVGAFSEKTFVVTNTGCQTLNVTSTTTAGTDAGQFPVTSGGAPFSLATGATRNVIVRFTPASGGSKSALFRLVSNDPAEATLDVSLSGEGCSVPEISTNLASVQYGSVLFGTYRDTIITVSNSGCQSLAVSATGISGTNASQFSIYAGGAPFAVPQGGTANITVRYTPTECGAKTAILNIVSNDPDEGTVSITVQGTGDSPQDIAVNPLTRNYGSVNVGAYGEQTFAVTNTGCQTVSISATSFTGGTPGEFAINSGGAPFTVASGASHNLVVRFVPTAGGAKATTLQVTSDDPDEATINITLSGEGCEPPDIVATPNTWDYGLVNVGAHAEKIFVISNDSCQTLQVSAMTFVGTNPTQFSITGGAAPFSLSQGTTRNVTVRFTPTSGGAKSATLQITNNVPSKNPATIVLNGEGCSRPDIGLDPDSWDYGVVNVGSSKDKVFVVSNVGCQDLSVTAATLGGTNPGHFLIVAGGAPFTVPQGGSHSITVRFQPTTVGSKSATLVVTSNDPDEGTVAAILSGGVCGIQDIAVDLAAWDYEEVNLGSYEDKTFVISNVGCQDLSVTATTIIGTHAVQFAIQSGGGSFTLTQGQTRSVVVRFSPVSGGIKTATLQITSNDPDEGLVNITMSGEGCAPPDISVLPASWNYGTVNVGAFSEKTFVVSNDSCQTLSVSSAAITGANAALYTIISGGAPFNVVTNGTRNIVVRFTPQAGGGTTAALRLVSNDPDEGTVDITLSGTGCGVPDISVAPGSVNFGTVNGGSSKDTTIVVSNDSCQTLQVTGTSLVGADPGQFSIVSGGAPFSVAKGGLRNIVVRFTPLSAGAKNATLRITNNDPDEGTKDVALSGFGNAPDIQLSAATYDYGSVNLGSSANWTLVVTNTGNQNLILSNITLDNPDFTITPAITFPVTLAAAAIRNVIIRFMPSVSGPRSATATITSNDPDESSVTISLNGTGCGLADIAVSPASWDYGSLNLGSTLDQTFEVSNTGCQVLNVTSTTLTGAGASSFSIIQGGGAFSLAAGGLRQIVVRFAPTTAGAKIAALQINNNDADESPKMVNLQGLGCSAPDISADPSSWSYGKVNVGGYSDITIVVSNAGCQSLTVSGTSIVGGNPDQFSIRDGGGSFVLASGATRSVVVRFQPTSGGAKSAGLQIASNDPDEGGLIISLTGQGCSYQDVAVTPASWDYGVVNVGSTKDKTFVISNEGCQDLNVTATALVGTHPDQFSVVSGGGAFTVLQGGSREVVVRFAPTSVGSKSGVLRFQSNDPDEGTFDVPLAGGVCALPDISVDPGAWGYGAVAVGANTSKTFTISNTGCQSLSVTATSLVGANADLFRIMSGGAPFTLAQGSTHDVVVRFAPTSEGTKTAGFRITSNDPDEGTVNVPLDGTGCGSADIAVTPPSWDFAVINIASFGEKTFEIANAGCQPLSVTSTTLTGTNADQFSISSGMAPFTVQQGGTHTMVVRFSPTSGGEKTASLRILSGDPDEGTVLVTLSGEGCISPDIAVNPLFWNYGQVSVGSNSDKTISISNTGCQDLQITSTSIIGTNQTEFIIISGGGFITVSAGGVHNMVVRFNPTSGGGKEAALRIISNDPDEGVLEMPLSGSGCGYGDIDLNPTSWDFGTVNVGNVKEKVLTVSNTGCQTLQVSGTALVGSDAGQFSIVSGGAPFTLSGGQSRDVLVRFTPTSGGDKSAVLQVTSNDPDEGIRNIPLTGEGCTRQDISINPTSWNYGTIDIGAFSDKTFVLSNVGCQPLQVMSVSITGSHPDQFSVRSGDGSFNLVPGETRNIVVRFAPTTAGSKNASLHITSNDPDEAAVDVGLSGGVCLGPDITLSPSVWDFGAVSVGQHRDKSMVVSNTGCQLLEVSATNVVGADGGSFSVVSGGGSFTVLQGESHTLVVRFSPTSGSSKSASLQIVSNDPDEATVEILLNGSGCSLPDISLNPSSWNYGQVSVGSQAEKTFVISNTGCQDLAVSGTSVVGTDASQFAIISGGGSFAVVQGGSHTLVVRFTPDTGGAKAAALVIHSSDPDEEEFSVPLSGGALSPDIRLAATSHDFGGSPIGQPVYWILEVSNEGDGDLVITNITTSRKDFIVSYPTFPHTIQPDSFRSIVVVFTPSVSGLVTGNLTVNSNDIDSPASAVSLRGLGLVPDIELSNTRHDFDGVSVGSSMEWTLTITNSGTGDLSINSMVSDNPVFALSASSFTVPSGGNRLVTVTFTPEEEGYTSGQVTIRSSDPDEPIRTVLLTGEGLVPDIEVVTSHNFGNVPVGNFAIWTMIVSNMGTGALVVTGIGADDPDFAGAPTSFTVVPGGSRNVLVTFSPSRGGAIAGRLTLASNDPDEAQVTVYVMGNGMVPDIHLPVTSFNFGGVQIGGSSTWNMAVQNIGTGDLHVTNITSNSLAFSIAQASFNVTPGGSADVPITFAPLSGGSVVAQLTIISSDPDEPTVSVNVSGTGMVPDIDVSATSHNFEGIPVGGSAKWILTVFNVGTGELEVTDIVSTSANFMVDITAFVIAPSGSRNVSVTFRSSAEGVFSGQLTIYCNDPDEPTVGIMVNGEAQVPDIEIPNTSHDFDLVDINTSVQWTLLIENVGKTDLIVTDVRSDNSVFTVTPPTLPLIIGPMSSQGVVVTFTPTAQEPYAGKLTITTSNDPDEPNLNVSLTGRGKGIGVQLLDFAAKTYEGAVLLRWAVRSVEDCLGFHVWRSRSPEDGYERLTTFFIPAIDESFTYRDESVEGDGTFYYSLQAVDRGGCEEEVGMVAVKVEGITPAEFGLTQNYPNPFNPATAVNYQIPMTTSQTRTTLKIFNILGQEVATLVDEVQEAGYYRVTWDGRDGQGEQMSSGIYFAVLNAGTQSDQIKMVLMK